LHLVCRLVYLTHFHFCTHIHAVVIICVCQIFIKETACLLIWWRRWWFVLSWRSRLSIWWLFVSRLLTKLSSLLSISCVIVGSLARYRPNRTPRVNVQTVQCAADADLTRLATRTAARGRVLISASSFIPSQRKTYERAHLEQSESADFVQDQNLIPIQYSNTHFRNNPDPGVCRIAPKMYWIHCLVGMSHFAKYSKNLLVTVWEMLINLQKTLFHNGEGNGKVIRNPHPGPDHHQTLTTSRESPLAHAYRVWSTFVNAFAHRENVRVKDRMTERTCTAREQSLQLVSLSLIELITVRTLIQYGGQVNVWLKSAC